MEQAAHRARIRADEFDRLLPQLQCTRCGFAGCRPYAEALASGSAAVNLCTPGGESTARALAELAGQEHADTAGLKASQACLAAIDAENCVGCIKCIEACPVDAIVGSAGLEHTVLAEWCTGCGLCVEPCPTDCISMHAANQGASLAELMSGGISNAEQAEAAELLKARYQAKKARPSLRNRATSGQLQAAELAAAAVRRAKRGLKK